MKLAGITGQEFNAVDRRRVLIFAADNGIAREGVTSAPQSVTLRQTVNFTRGVTAERVIRDMATFEETAIDDAYLAEIRTNPTYQGEA